MQPADQAEFINALANYYYNAKNYAKAIEWLKRYQKESTTPLKVRPSLVRAYYLSGDYANAKAELMPLIADAEKAGQKPTQEDLRLLASSAAKLKDTTTYVAAAPHPTKKDSYLIVVMTLLTKDADAALASMRAIADTAAAIH